MSTNKIKIDHVTGGNNKDELKNCYFEPSSSIPGAYNFYDKNGHELAGGLLPGESFEFELDGLIWIIYEWSSDRLHAHGSWKNNGPDPTGEQNGTFTAQAGGGVDVDDETGQGDRIFPLDQIQIDAVFDADRVRITSPLVGCFFSPQSGPDEYMLFGQQGKTIKAQIKSDEIFTIDFAGTLWDLTVHVSPGNNKAHGTWMPHGKGTGEGTGGVDGDGGTYTAQAGGGVPTAVSASA
jgi:hypothetical protein